MKHNTKNNSMAKLGRKTVIQFLVMTLIAGILSDIAESLFDHYATYAIEKDEHMVVVLTAMLLFADILIYVTSGFVFYLLTRKAFKKENERQIREKDLIYAAIAHDLKTPMTSVQGFAKALSDGKIRPEEQQEIFDIIYRKSNSMNDMVNTLFDYAKLGTDGYKPAFAAVDLCALVRDIIAENYCDFENHNIELDIDIPDSALMINADKTELKRAVTNLIVNIYKHNPEGIRARVSVRKDSDKAEIRIADSGEPLPDGMDIFEPFVTENTARTAGHGTGLGLAVTKRVIENHGGKICVETADSDYTKMFVIRL